MNDRSVAMGIDEVATDEPSAPDVVLCGPPNWTAVLFLAVLGTIHLCIAIPSFVHGRWEGYLSLVFGVVFIAAAIACRLTRREIAIQPSRRCVSVRTRCRRLSIERQVPFDRIRGVRVTLMRASAAGDDSRIELLCDGEEIECPPTTVPRQEALYLAVAMNVPLIKVMDEEPDPPAPRLS